VLGVRTIVRIRGYAPAVLLSLAVAIGQAIAWFLMPEEAAALVCIIALLSITRIRRIEPILSGVLVGLVTGALVTTLQTPARASFDGSVLIRVEESPRRIRSDQVVFVGRDLLSPSRQLLRCTAVELPWRNSGELQKGSVVWIRGELRSVVRPLNPFSWEGWLWRSGIAGTVKVRYVSSPLEHSAHFMEEARVLIAQRVRAAVGDRRGGELFLSMAFGFRDVLSPPVEQSFTALGLKHLLVVSGYQVSLVFAVCSGFSLSLMRRFPLFSRWARTLATALAFGAALMFVAFIGSEMSALRALVAAACVCSSKIFECSGRYAQRWGVALLIVELLSPWALFDVGVQLTFAALAGIGVGVRLGEGSTTRGFLWVTASAWLFTSAVMLAWNGTVSLIGLFLNLTLAAPWSFLNCVVGGAGVLLLLLFGDLGSWVVRIVAWCNEEIAALLMVMSELPAQSLTFEGAWRSGVAVLSWCLAGVLGVVASTRSSIVPSSRQKKNHAVV
jgi:ComEC/Rec2-related protein